MISAEHLRELTSPIAQVFPAYYHDISDINEALDHGEANCAVRAYASGLLLRSAYPNRDLYVVEFGFSDDHGDAHIGKNGRYTHVGHAAIRFYVPGNTPMVLESYTDSMLEIMAMDDRHDGYTWMDLDDGYRVCLDRVGQEDVVVDAGEILGCLIRKVATVATAGPTY